MTPNDVKTHYKTLYRFNKETGMSASSLKNWIKWGYIPYLSQKKLEDITNGELKAVWDGENHNQ